MQRGTKDSWGVTSGRGKRRPVSAERIHQLYNDPRSLRQLWREEGIPPQTLYRWFEWIGKTASQRRLERKPRSLIISGRERLQLTDMLSEEAYNMAVALHYRGELARTLALALEELVAAGRSSG